MQRCLSTAVLTVACCVGLLALAVDANSCQGRCGSMDSGQSCQCNSQCTRFGDCCVDYHAVCHGSSCNNRCGQNVNHNEACQCNSQCTTFGDCCSDYDAICNGNGAPPPPQTCMSTREVSYLMWGTDTNGFRDHELTIHYQGRVPNSDYAPDSAESNLIADLNTAKVSGGTYALFNALLDNYNPHRGQLEVDTPHQLAEESDFLDAILATPVMGILLEYAQCRGWVNDVAGLRQRLIQAWFEEYPRSGSSSIPDSSGFEHVMVGEYSSDTKVTGFHNWLAFYQYEAAGDLNYYGYVNKSEPRIIGAALRWNGRFKSLASFLLGVSPELDLALYSLAFWNSPNGRTDVTLDGHNRQIQTYEKDGHIATAFISV